APNDADTTERLIRSARVALERRPRSELVGAPPHREEPRAAVAPTARDPKTRAAIEQLEALASSEEPVLLTGEGSSGKGVFARVLHERSARREGPYVVLRCATLFDAAQIEAALGPRGAPGTPCLALGARGGTLVLDEVG